MARSPRVADRIMTIPAEAGRIHFVCGPFLFLLKLLNPVPHLLTYLCHNINSCFSTIDSLRDGSSSALIVLFSMRCLSSGSANFTF